jgi:spore coat protein U-like protein
MNVSRMKLCAVALTVAVTVSSVVLARAATPPSVVVTGDVIGNCTTISPANAKLTIGNYDPFSYPTGQVLSNPIPLTLTTQCTLGDTISWSVGIGSHCGLGTLSGDRAMADTPVTHYLSYELYSTSAFSSNAEWSTNGCATPPTTSQTGVGTGSTYNQISIYGLIPGGQNTPVGSYSDSVQVTLNY